MYLPVSDHVRQSQAQTVTKPARPAPDVGRAEEQGNRTRDMIWGMVYSVWGVGMQRAVAAADAKPRIYTRIITQ